MPGGAVSGFDNGIEDLADDAVIAGQDLVVQDNMAAGVWVRDATGSVVKGVSFNSNGGAGIRLLSGTTALLRNIIVGSQLYGIWDQGGHGSTISGNVIDVSGTAGILLGCLPVAHLHVVGFRGTQSFLEDHGQLPARQRPLRDRHRARQSR